MVITGVVVQAMAVDDGCSGGARNCDGCSGHGVVYMVLASVVVSVLKDDALWL